MSINKELVKDLREAQEQIAKLQAVVDAATKVLDMVDSNGLVEVDDACVDRLEQVIEEVK